MSLQRFVDHGNLIRPQTKSAKAIRIFRRTGKDRSFNGI